MYGVDGVVGFTYDGVGEYFYKKNIFGDIIGILDKNGQEITKYVYDAWGNHKTYVLNDGTFVDISENVSYTTNGLNNKLLAEINPFRYRGYYYDAETKLYYLNSRYYDPETGRFINADDVLVLDHTQDVINGLNLYAYCLNNPVNDFDSDGDLPWWLKLLIGIAFVVIGALVTAATAGAGTGFWAAFGSALVTSLIQTGISTAISAGIGMVIGGVTTGTWEGAFNGLINGAVDGFMWGGIFSGGAQILSGGFKGLAKLGVPTGKHGGIAKTGIFSPDRIRDASEIAKIAKKGQHFYDYGGTILKFTKNFHIDVSTKSFLHLSFNFFGKIVKHFPLGAILGGIIGGIWHENKRANK